MNHCTSKLVEIERWFGSMPEGAAEMEIDTSHGYYESVLTIRPMLVLEAGGFEVGFAGDQYDVWLVEARGEFLGGYQDNSCRDDSPLVYCRAIASGGLTVTEYTCGGRRAVLRHELRLGGGVLDYNWYGEWGGWGHTGTPWTRTWRRAPVGRGASYHLSPVRPAHTRCRSGYGTSIILALGTY